MYPFTPQTNSQELKMNAIAKNVTEIVHDNEIVNAVDEQHEQFNISKEMKKMPAKYIKQSHLLFWFLNELHQKGAMTTEKYTELLEHTMIFNTDVTAQVQLYEHFEQESANVAKVIKSQMRERKQSGKTTKKSMPQDGDVIVAKRGRKKTPVRVVSDNQNDLIADLVKLANEDVDVVVATNAESPKPKRKYVRKNPTSSPVEVAAGALVAPIEADVADVKPKRNYVRKSPVSSPKTSQPIEVAAETVIVAEPTTSIVTTAAAVADIAPAPEEVTEEVNKVKRKYVRKNPISSPKTSPPIEISAPPASTVIITEPTTYIVTAVTAPTPEVTEEVNKVKRKYVRKSPVSSPKTSDTASAVISILSEEPVVVPIPEVTVVVNKETPVVVVETQLNAVESELSMESFENEESEREEGEISDQEEEEEDVECETLVLSQFISNGGVSHLIDPATNELYDLEGNELVGIYDPITKTIKDILK